MNPDASASYLALYFIFFAVGRLLGGVVAEKLGYIKTFLVCIIASVLLFASGIILNSALLFAMIGLFTSIFFPLFLPIVVREFREDAPAVINVIIPLNSVLFMASSVLLGVLNGQDRGAGRILYFRLICCCRTSFSVSSK